MAKKKPSLVSQRGKKITDDQKAEILVRKEIGGPDHTQVAIAADLGISRESVQKVQIESVNSRALELYQKKKAALRDLAVDTTTAALKKSKQLIEKASSPKFLGGVAAAGRFADTVMRLETGEATAIVRTASAEQHVIEFFRVLVARSGYVLAVEGLRKASLEPLVGNARKEEILGRIESGELYWEADKSV
jgi:hypothetical protein